MVDAPLPCQRELFAMPRDIAYLNCANSAPLAVPVVAAMQEGITHKLRPWEHGSAEYFSVPDQTRAAFARLFNATADDIAIVPSASYGLAVAARNLPVGAGQEIVVLDRQFPANVFVWREVARQASAHVVTAKRGPDEAWSAAVLASIGPRTAIVAVPHCHWIDGGMVDLAAVRLACRAVGAALVLDLTQSLGAMPFDVRAIDPDFAVAACYKWMLGPYGIAALYVAPRHQQGVPIEQTWAARRGAEDFSRLADYCEDFQPGARRFDMGEKSNRCCCWARARRRRCCLAGAWMRSRNAWRNAISGWPARR